MLSLGPDSVAIYDDDSGELIASAREEHENHNSIEVNPDFRGLGYATKILDILEQQIGEKKTERVGKTNTALFYIKRGYVPTRKITTDISRCFNDEEIETEKITKQEEDDLLSYLKKSLESKEETPLPFPVLLQKNESEAKIYQMLLSRKLKRKD